MCGHENDPNIFLKMASIAGGPTQFVTIALATCKKKITPYRKKWSNDQYIRSTK